MSDNSIIKRILNWIKKALVETGYFLSSRIFLKNLIIALGILALLLFLVFKFLNVYTKHGESITLPDLRGQSLELAEEQMKGKHIELFVIDSLYFPDKKPFTILEQDPLPDSKVKESRKVYLTVNASVPPPVNVPDVWGKDVDFAKRLLRARGFSVHKKIEYKSDPAVNTVLQVKHNGKQLIRPNTKDKKSVLKIPKGSELKLVVAEGGGSSMVVPRLVCQTMDEAGFQIQSYNLNLGSVMVDETVKDTASAYIWKQNPDYSRGDIIRMGEQVDIWLTATKPGECQGW